MKVITDVFKKDFTDFFVSTLFKVNLLIDVDWSEGRRLQEDRFQWDAGLYGRNHEK